ncbi:MAG: hypothetical protein H7333_06740 [Bdellovibrionales bacterium]|nr:hypothetical protein [Oligoflexia bacterium]
MKLSLIAFAAGLHCLASAEGSVIALDAARWWTGHPLEIQVCLGQRSEEAWVYGLIRPESVTPITPEMGTLISAVLAAEYSRDGTGVEFKINGQCAEVGKAKIDAVLFIGNERYTNYEGTTGFTGFPESSSRGTLLPFIKIILSKPTSFAVVTHSVIRFPMKTEDQFKITLIHEFGHLAGLAHEQNRAEAKVDLNCKLLPKAHRKPGHDYGNASLPPGSTAYGDYDASSLMNYCFEAYLKENTMAEQVHLSAGDRAVLQHLYPKID